MKIKTDFITNSSSTMYIFYIPESFELNKSDIFEFSEEFEWLFDENEKDRVNNDASYEEYLLENLPNLFKELRTVGSLWTYGDDQGCPQSIYYIIHNILKKYDLEIQTIEIGYEGSNQLITINPDRIKQIFLAEGLKHIQVKGTEDVTKD